LGYPSPLPLTFRHWAGVSPYTSPFGFAETCGFVNQSLEPLRCDPQRLTCVHLQGHPFSRSYGAMLPSSLTRVLPFTWVCSTHLPVSVCGTGTRVSSFRGFSRQLGLTHFRLRGSLHTLSSRNGFPYPSQRLPVHTPTPPIVGWFTFLRPLFTRLKWSRNVDRVAISYALRPRLRT
jgi:hypothetical protein